MCNGLKKVLEIILQRKFNFFFTIQEFCDHLHMFFFHFLSCLFSIQEAFSFTFLNPPNIPSDNTFSIVRGEKFNNLTGKYPMPPDPARRKNFKFNSTFSSNNILSIWSSFLVARPLRLSPPPPSSLVTNFFC